MLCSRPASLYFASPRFLGLVTCVLYNSDTCGERAGFSNILSAGGSTLAGRWSAVARLLPHYHCNGWILWTEPVKSWRKACRLACLNHTVLLQIMKTLSSSRTTLDEREGARPTVPQTVRRRPVITKRSQLLPILCSVHLTPKLNLQKQLIRRSQLMR